MILQELLRLQDRFGYLPRRELLSLARRLAVPLYRVHEVASFYPHFRVFPSDAEEAQGERELPQFEIAVCRDMACRLRGSAEYQARLSAAMAPHGARVKVCGVSCLGRCDRPVAVRMAQHERGASAQKQGEHEGRGIRALLGRPIDEVVRVCQAVIEGHEGNPLPDDRDEAHLPAQSAETWRINAYAGQPEERRYAAVRRFIESAAQDASREAERDRIIKALETANLLGMGGAGGRAYKKWSEVRQALGERKYVVCNADESEPGTFKDRELLLRVPHLVVEGMILGGLVVGAEQGYIYIRHEYEEAIAHVRREIEAARRAGHCGDDILGSGLKFNLEVFVSPGGYICGEQTALVQAIQDERAEPRNRPPELQTNGLWNMPTLLNNVETLAWVPAIVTRDGGDGQWYVRQGAPGYKGSRFFSVSGDVNRPGVYEVPIGIKLGELIQTYCEGIIGGKAVKALALSGPSGGFLPRLLPLDSFSPAVREKAQQLSPPGAKAFDLMDLPLDLGVTRSLRLMLGAAIVVYAEGADLVDQALACQRFFQAESCGKCLPCRIGSTKLAEIGDDLAAGRLSAAQIEQLVDRTSGSIAALAQAMADTAICGLGTSAPSPLRSLLAYFPEDVRRRLRS
jgi:NADH:ubiquinone oxidoreductase subunit F (NADH-binding)/NADH:ubiquinone oxidoreductase subunit E